MKKNILVIFGGKSNEHEISEKSAAAVIKNADKSKYQIIKMGITEDGKTYRYYGNITKIRNGKWKYDSRNEPCVLSQGKIITVEERVEIDVCLPILHGKNGEDGKIAALLDFAEIKYAGCPFECGAVCMDKDLAKTVLEKEGVKTAKYIKVFKGDGEIEKKTESALSYPVFVKPSRSGSSVGASKVETREELKKALEIAFVSDEKVLIEEYVEAREIEVGVLEVGGKLTVSKPGELLNTDGFYDYNLKYKSNRVKAKVPASITSPLSDEIRSLAEKIFKTLECKTLARIDFFLTDKVIFNEINTMPGFTSISMYPKLMEDCGIGFRSLIDKMIESALL